MDAIASQLLSSVISGLLGGAVTGVAAISAIRIEIKYLRRDVDHAHKRIDRVEERPMKTKYGEPT
jgi:hypothetical protein